MEVDTSSNKIEIINAAAVHRANKCLSYVFDNTVELEDVENDVYGIVNVCIRLGAEPIGDTSGTTKDWKSVFDQSVIEAAFKRNIEAEDRRNKELLRYKLVTGQYDERLRYLTRLACKLADVHCKDADKNGWSIDFGKGFRDLQEAENEAGFNQSSY